MANHSLCLSNNHLNCIILLTRVRANDVTSSLAPSPFTGKPDKLLRVELAHVYVMWRKKPHPHRDVEKETTPTFYVALIRPL